MKKVLITGGCGTVGQAFIKEFYNQYEFISLSRNQEKQHILKTNYPDVKLEIASIENSTELTNIFLKTKPDIVIHAAALKQIDVAQKKPSEAIKINVTGSLNVIAASKAANVSITTGISSDKACLSNSVYGHTKSLMEQLFIEANTDQNKFACCRLCNVAGSVGSVIPFWLQLAKANLPLKITDPNMNRFMFSQSDAANLIQKAIDQISKNNGAFILIKKLKAVNMSDLANVLSSDVETIGKRAGERLDEALISADELPFSTIDGDYVFIGSEKNASNSNQLTASLCTIDATRMNSSEIKNLINTVEENV